MLRNPYVRQQQVARREARLAGIDAVSQGRGNIDASSGQQGGATDPATGKWVPAGLLDFTPLDTGDGFRLT